MSFANPAGWWFLAAALPILVLHILRPRREPTEVPSTFLWRELARPVSAARPWQRLRPSALLALQLLAVVLLAALLARPVARSESELFAHTVFIIDASGSMAAADGDPDRLASARAEALDLYDELPAGAEASLVVAGARSEVLVTSTTERDEFRSALERTPEPSGSADFAGAFTLAASLERPGTEIGFVLLSDGGLDDAARAQLLPDTTYVPIGERSTNRGITRLLVEPIGSGLRATIQLRNTGDEAATQTLRVDVDGVTTWTTEVRLDRGEVVDLDHELPAGDRVEAFLEGEDLLDVDDRAFAVTARRRPLTVAVVGAPDIYLDTVLGAIDGVTIERVADAEAAAATDADLVVYDQVDPPAAPEQPFLAIAAPGGIGDAVRPLGATDAPIITLVDAEDALLRGLDLADVAIARAQRVDPGPAEVLVAAESVPLLLRGRHGGQRFAATTFVLGDSTLPLDLAFPILIDRLLVELAGAALPPGGSTVGDQLPLDTTAGATLHAPGGTTIAVAPGDPTPRTDRTGFWTIEVDGRPDRTVAVNADPRESLVAPEPALPTELRPETAAREASLREDPRWQWFVPPLLLVLLLELLLARRSIGVAPRQWQVAIALRVLIAALLVLSLLDLDRISTSDRVSVVFLLDGSDSLSADGRAAGADYVRAALDDQPAGARSAVVLFGADARLELPVDIDNQLGTPMVQVDATHTDVAGALRLGAALLPEDTRRRIVLVSDGRATRGDAADEAQRLRSAGIQVDHHVLERATGDDLAVVRVDSPGLAATGDAVEMTATVEASVAGEATVTLTRDGAVVDEQIVALEAGSNEVTFTDVAGEPGLQRYQVRVSGDANAVAENDLGFGAVEVAGASSVLVVEGADGVADDLVAALRSGGLEVTTTSPVDLPALDEVARHATIVLVDVDERSLAAAQIDVLSSAVRDLGRGLVTIGGDRSYGLGGYLGTELEQLLPVISEIQDPERRLSVAQVLAIDSSGSMGACHCNDGANGMVGGGNRADGGVNKTDIARSAAARTLDALSANDEIGILAFNVGEKWIVPLQELPSDEVVLDGLRTIAPAGGTDLSRSLSASAEALRTSKASLRHIILFTDGFTGVNSMEDLAEQAADLREEGITVSVLATGEGASEDLRPIAEAGGGRFYPGTDLQQIPEIMMQESITASRSFVTEGEFLPLVASRAEVVAGLTESPPLLGYIATTPKPTAQSLLRIGDESDPLLATWQVGLGRSTAWTSDASARWSQQWATWDGYSDFWTAVVKDAMSVGDDAGAVRASIVDGRLRVVAESEDPWPEGTTITGRVTTPGLDGQDLRLERVSATTFAADVDAPEAGTYAVGVQIAGPDGQLLSGRALTNQSYGAEYRPGPADDALLDQVSAITGGRGAVDASSAFDPGTLDPGRVRSALAPLLLLAAALLWPVAVAVSRLAPRGALVSGARDRAGRLGDWAHAHRPALPGRSRTPRPPRAPRAPSARKQQAAQEEAAPTTVGRLLERKRELRGDQSDDD